MAAAAGIFFSSTFKLKMLNFAIREKVFVAFMETKSKEQKRFLGSIRYVLQKYISLIFDCQKSVFDGH